MKSQKVRHMPVNPAKCQTCPFREGGDPALRAKIEARVLSEASQTCHHSGAVHGKPDTRLCRGARDFQLTILHRMGFLEAATDEAWERQCQKQGL